MEQQLEVKEKKSSKKKYGISPNMINKIDDFIFCIREVFIIVYRIFVISICFIVTFQLNNVEKQINKIYQKTNIISYEVYEKQDHLDNIKVIREVVQNVDNATQEALDLHSSTETTLEDK